MSCADNGWRHFYGGDTGNVLVLKGLSAHTQYSIALQPFDRDTGAAGCRSDAIIITTCPPRCLSCTFSGVCTKCDATSMLVEPYCIPVTLDDCPPPGQTGLFYGNAH